ncbi:MAG: NADH-quinone oxidoreductase subunit L [Desulfobacterales bacterium]|jgi:NADH-quinone oxidoreductase subunit L|nr:NADH-quinone oxidoreductase subunit L [Desulfobacterales bacterium]
MIDLIAISPDLMAAVSATLTPFAAFFLIIIFFRARPKVSAALSIGAIGVAFISAVFLLIRHWEITGPIVMTGRWMGTKGFTLPFGFFLDPVSLLMLTVVTAICLLVQIYSLGYMAGDSGFSRYYAEMSLFAWAMTSLTVSPTLLQLYIFWELVGLSSYLLIGFWFEKFSATQAGKKAFVMTRAGDVAFFLGILLVFYGLGSLNFTDINAPESAARMPPLLLTVSALLIFCGIIGKSAQFPLMTWLPDAMEGPTPVSALLHSATMVAAGVFLMARLFPYFSQSETVMTICMSVGCISMLLAATMAMVSRDIKQVWAYSTISQLGLMIMGLAAGDRFSGLFHLTTHAGFKALLFLCSGVFIHAFGTNDAQTLGKKHCRRMKLPMICLVIGVMALSGLPPFSGFFSKESIMTALAGLNNPIWLAAALVGVFLTAYYAFRLVFLMLLPDKPEETANEAPHLHGVAGVMALPLIILAGVTVGMGFFDTDLAGFLRGAVTPSDYPFSHSPWLPITAMGLAVMGGLLSWVEFGRSGAARKGFVARVPALLNLFQNRWYLDHLYRFLVDRVIDRGISRFCAQNDQRVIDGVIDGFAEETVSAGRRVSMLHAGMIQHRIVVTFAIVVFLALYFFLS